MPVAAAPSWRKCLLDEQQPYVVRVRQNDVVLRSCRCAHKVARPDVEQVVAHRYTSSSFSYCPVFGAVVEVPVEPVADGGQTKPAGRRKCAPWARELTSGRRRAAGALSS